MFIGANRLSSSMACGAAILICAGSYPAEAHSQIDKLFEKYETQSGPGVAVLAVKNNVVFHVGGYGLADTASVAPILTTTIFNLASDSKQFTAMAAAILHERGLLDYDASISKYIANIPEYAKAVRVRDLIRHTSGLPDYTQLCEVKSLVTNRDVVLFLHEKKHLNFTPGDRFEYSNTGYSLLALVIEGASGMTFPDFVESEILDVLGMFNTHVIRKEFPDYNGLAQSYHKDATPYTNTACESIYGDGGVFTSVSDLRIWAHALETPDLLVTKDTLESLFQPGHTNSGQTIPYGFGWEIHGSTVAHTGSWLGFENCFTYFRQKKEWVFTLSNSEAYDCTSDTAKIRTIMDGN